MRRNLSKDTVKRYYFIKVDRDAERKTGPILTLPRQNEARALRRGAAGSAKEHPEGHGDRQLEEGGGDQHQGKIPHGGSVISRVLLPKGDGVLKILRFFVLAGEDVAKHVDEGLHSRVRLPPLPLMNRAKVRARLATVMMRLTMTPVVTALEV